MKRLFLATVYFTLISFSIFSQKFSGWKQAETNHFKFIYEKDAQLFAEGYALYADEAWNKISKAYGFPQDKTNVFITHRTNTVNAYTFSVPTEIVMFTTPYITPDFGFRENWQKLFFTHELIHVANMVFEEKPDFLSKAFGCFFNNLDLGDIPNWEMEGLATLLETELTNGGRGRSPYFELLYKAPTLDNGFISYTDIDNSNEPPRGQSYVMGYLIMRSIADRWGLQAVSDIERNRIQGKSFNESVRLVTGITAAEIYNDVRISLAKKYNKERTIPEGITISPRNTNLYYFNPAIVNKDGSFIALRSFVGSGAYAVKFDPSARRGSNWYMDTKPEKDLNTVYKETILFSGKFTDETAITADDDGTVYASMSIERSDRAPGTEVENAIYVFTEKDGIKQLTSGTSLFQPSVSKNGRKLVAVEQNDTKMKIVNVDIQNGQITTILESDKYSYVQPSLNEDGTKLAFLSLDDSRAAVCFCNLNEKLPVINYVANHQGKITDPSFPNWNSDGKLTYADNKRGRLEIFEVNEKNNTFESIPVVSDPIGATWAYKTDKGIYYASYASTGNVIKMKPLSEWGKVPEFNGPSEPGEIVKLGSLASDYPDFTPFEIPSEKEITKEEARQYIRNKSDQQIPVLGKYVEHRSEELKDRADNLESGKTTLENEKTYIPLPTPVLYIPTFSLQEVPESNSQKFGFGYALLAFTPRLQNNDGGLIANITLFPGMQNFEGLFGGLIPIGDSTLAFWADRNFTIEDDSGTSYFKEKNNLMIGYTNPIYHVVNLKKETDIAFISSIQGTISREDIESFAVGKNLPVNYGLNGQIGIDCNFKRPILKNDSESWKFSLLGLGLYNFDYNKMYAGLEGEMTYLLISQSGNYEFNMISRYTNFPAKENDFMTRAIISGKEDNCIYPGKIVLKGSYIMPSFLLGLRGKLYGAYQINFGKNNVDYPTPDSGILFNITMDSSIYAGAELGITNGRMEVYGGTNIPFDFSQMKFGDWQFYLSCKLDWIRF